MGFCIGVNVVFSWCILPICLVVLYKLGALLWTHPPGVQNPRGEGTKNIQKQTIGEGSRSGELRVLTAFVFVGAYYIILATIGRISQSFHTYSPN